MSKREYKGPPLRKPNPTDVQASRPPGVRQQKSYLAKHGLGASQRFPHKLTVGAHKRMADLDFDPIEWSVKVARGEELTKDHPFLDYLRKWHMAVSADMEAGNPIDWDNQVHDLLQEANKSLTDSWVPLNLRSDHIRDLMGYLYPKLKAVEHSGSVSQHISIKPLKASEVELFLDKFDSRY